MNIFRISILFILIGSLALIISCDKGGPDNQAPTASATVSDQMVEPGALLEFEEDAGMRINDGGALLAQGTAEASIVMSGVEAIPGFWRGLYFRADDRTSDMNYVEVAYGGREAYGGVDEPANIAVEAVASLSLNNSTIRNSAGWGTWVDYINLNPLAGGGNEYNSNASGDVGHR